MNYHMYADDTQLYQGVSSANMPDLITSTELCIQDVKSWMDSNKLKLNDNKTEIMLCINTRCAMDPPISVDTINVHINAHAIQPSQCVKNLGVFLDQNMSMDTQIYALCRSLLFQLRKIASIRNFLSEEAAKMLVTTLVLSRLDYCNALLAGTTEKNIAKLQVIQNHAAKLIKRKKKYDHATPIREELHWLPVRERIIYKTAVMCYKCLNDKAPSYLSQLLELHVPALSHLRSGNDALKLVKPSTDYKTYGDHSFSFFGPHIWNDLPYKIRNATSLSVFKQNLKTHLFLSAYS